MSSNKTSSTDTACGQVEIIDGMLQNGCLGWLRKSEE